MRVKCKRCLTCQGYSPIWVSTPPTIFRLFIVFGTPQAGVVKLCNKYVALFEKLTTKVFIVAGVDAHLGRVDSRTVASTIFPVTTSGHVHSTRINLG